MQAFHKEKFNVPIDASHIDLHTLTKYVVALPISSNLPQGKASDKILRSPSLG